MKQLIYKFIYSRAVSALLLPVSYLSYRLVGKKLMAVTGRIRLKVDDISFVLDTNQSSHIAQDLYYIGAVDYEFTPFVRDLIQTEKVFFDIGANIGYFSILTSKAAPDARIFAFEPSVGSLHYLERNVALNGCQNVTVIDKAVSDIDGHLTFHEVTNSKYPWLEHNLNGSNSLNEGHLTLNHRSYEVGVVTLKKVMADHQLEQLDLIKLDTECTEHIILKESAEIINTYRPIIISEIYPAIETQIEQLLNEELRDYDFYQYLQENNENQLKPISGFEGIDPEDLNRNFVFVPKEKGPKVEAYIKK